MKKVTLCFGQDCDGLAFISIPATLSHKVQLSPLFLKHWIPIQYNSSKISSCTSSMQFSKDHRYATVHSSLVVQVHFTCCMHDCRCYCSMLILQKGIGWQRWGRREWHGAVSEKAQLVVRERVCTRGQGTWNGLPRALGMASSCRSSRIIWTTLSDILLGVPIWRQEWIILMFPLQHCIFFCSIIL